MALSADRNPLLVVQPAPNSDVGPEPATQSVWWSVADFGVFGAWLATVFFTLRYHEKWADEAQAWLLARDLDLRTLWFHELRYEGSPGLWHTMLWVSQHIFHLPYSVLGPIGAACAAAGVVFLLRKAPFPRPLRYLLSFGYFIVYQYAVIARPYALMPLLAFVAADLFRDRTHPERITLVLILLANLSVHGMLLSACLGFAYLIDQLKNWTGLARPVRRRFVLCVIALLFAAAILFLVLKPPQDVEALQASQRVSFSAGLSRTWEGLAGAFFDSSVLTIAWLAIAIAWCWQRKRLWTFVAPVFILAAFYGFVYGWVHHQGTIFVAAITGLWIAWPTTQESGWQPWQRWTHYANLVALVALLTYHIGNAAVAVRNDYLYPYSGAEDAARYLKSVGADRQRIFGYLYGMVGIQAYFDHNIESNSPTAYYHHGAASFANTLDAGPIESIAPDYIVVPCWYDVNDTFQRLQPFMAHEGYSLAHFSDGYMLSKRGVAMRQVYFIFRRN